MEILPKDLINIIEEYSKDRSSYDRVMSELVIVRPNLDLEPHYAAWLLANIHYHNRPRMQKRLKKSKSGARTTN